METETQYACQIPKCGKAFKSAPALRMHTIRAHGKGWDTSANFRKKNQTRDEVLARKRAYNTKMRAENIAKGLTGTGKPRKRAYRPKNKPIFGAKWTPERRAKFEKTWRAKNKAMKTQLQTYDRKIELVEKNSNHLTDPRGFFNHCPNCGHDLRPYFLAAGFKQHEPR